jgi:hypothetical protein
VAVQKEVLWTASGIGKGEMSFLPVPKALKTYFIAVFGPHAGQKLHNFIFFVPSAE